MAGNFYGADIAQLRRLAQDLANGANRLDQLGQQLGSSIATSPWKGHDGERFRSDWNASHAKVLRAAAAGIQSASKALLQNADQQDRASTGSTGGGAGGPGSDGSSPANATQEVTDKLTGMTAEERDVYLKSEEFQQWVRQSQANADAAKGVLDGLVDSGAMAPLDAQGNKNGYGQFLQQYWAESAMREAGIDPNHWDPSKGVDYNRADIYKVYAFYAELYKNDPRMEWIGMANQVGPTFIAGFEDLAVLRKAAAAGQDLSEQLDGTDPAQRSWITLLASLGESDLAYYEETFLSMQKEIFSDIGSQHFAYQQGGMEEIERMKAAGVVSPTMKDAWTSLDSVPAYSGPEGYHQLSSDQKTALHQASYNMADQEQNHVIADDYDNIRGRTTGEAFTAAMTVVGEPSIVGAKSYYEQFPMVNPYFDTNRSPMMGVDTHLGNISNSNDRWALIDQDTLRAYEDWLHGEKDPYGEMVKPMPQRVEEYRMVPAPVRGVVGAL
ncbi:WXG100 family type VII secretion target [Arthrobacter sp. NPDC093128]|uniref:WXG100 family type VII secretion target n=1 Tax=Arthrobacter sp. NPDC093128 TaxID=3154979 RepID=UPI003414C3DA